MSILRKIVPPPPIELAEGLPPAEPKVIRTRRGFENPGIPDKGRLRDFFRWQLRLGPQEAPALPPEMVPPYEPRVVRPDLLKLHRVQSPLQVTWIGHDTFLIQVAGLNLLTDPIYSDRASPFVSFGPRRWAPPGVPWGDLPPIQGVLISHNHYDHLDARTIRHLGRHPRYFVPLGLGRWFAALGDFSVTELEWWQAVPFGGIHLTCVPAQHWSMRLPFIDRNRSLWCGWVLTTPAGNLFYAGCTGYADYFRRLGEHFGPVRLAFIPIGSYMPRWFLRNMHANPPEAVRIHRDLGSRLSIGMHWGTFKLTDEPMAEPPLYLARALKEAGCSPGEFITLGLGETLELD